MKIKLNIQGREVELTPAEARALHKQLASIFAEAPRVPEPPPAPVLIPYPVIYPNSAPQPVNPQQPWFNPQQPWFDPWVQPTIICGAQCGQSSWSALCARN